MDCVRYGCEFMRKSNKTFNILTLFLVITQFVGCASRATLGTKSHPFSDKGKHIIWIQIEGLLPDHLPLLKYTREKADESISFEKMSCVGTTWSHNLYELRPRPTLGFVSQILGSQNIKGNCSDIDRKPVWSFFQEKGYEVGILESSNMKKRSLNQYASCNEKLDLFSNVHYWRSEKARLKNAQFFHYLNETQGMEAPGVYYDKSCQEKGCFVSTLTNVKAMWKNFKAKHAKTFTVVREVNYADHLNSGDITGALDILKDWDKYLSEIIEQAQGKSVTILVTSTAGRNIEFPKKGKQWSNFLKRGKSIIYRNQSLTAGTWAYGPGAENFCGIYEEDKVFERILWAPEKRFIDDFLL